MTKTENYQLNQWESSDRVLMEDFNEDNRKIEEALSIKGNCKVITGTYKGTGTYNNSNTNVKLTLGAKPVLMLIYGNSYGAILINANYGFAFYGTADTRGLNASYENGIVSWVSSGSAAAQLNTKDVSYTYFAFFMQ